MKLFTLVVGVGLITMGAGAQPLLHFDPTQVVVSGITPGGEVAWIAVAIERREWFPYRYHWRRLLLDDDGDGEVAFSRDKGIPLTSVFVAVDVATGEYATGSPPDYPHPGPLELPANAAVITPGGFLKLLREDRLSADVLVVRPRVGAWALIVRDGGPVDEDGEPGGGISIILDAMIPLGPVDPGPGGLRAKDVLVLIDPDTLEYFAGQVASHPH